MVSASQLLSFHLPLPFPSFSTISHYSRPPVHTNPQPRRLSEAIPGPTTPSAPPAIDRPRSNTHSGFLRRESSDVEFPTYDKRKHNKIRGLRIRKVHVSIKIQNNIFILSCKVLHVIEELQDNVHTYMYIHTTYYIVHSVSVHTYINSIHECAGLCMSVMNIEHFQY